MIVVVVEDLMLCCRNGTELNGLHIRVNPAYIKPKVCFVLLHHITQSSLFVIVLHKIHMLLLCDRSIFHIFPRSVHIAYFSMQTVTFSISICQFYANMQTGHKSTYLCHMSCLVTVRVFLKKLLHKTDMPKLV